MNTQTGPLRGPSNFLGIIFNKIPFDAEEDARFYMILENYPFGNWKWFAFGFAQDTFLFVRENCFENCHWERSKFKTDNYQTLIDLWQTVCLPLKKVLNIEFSRRSSCDLLKSNFSIARPISEASTCEAPNFFLNSANLITRTNSTGCGVQENEFWSFQVYCITLSAHFVKKKTLKSNIKRISKAQNLPQR